MYLQSYSEEGSCKHCCSGKTTSIIYSVCVCVAFVIQHAKRMRHIAICGLPTIQYISTLSHKRHDFQKKVNEHKMCVWSFSTNFSWNTSYSRKNWARYGQKYTSVCMYSTVILVWFQWNLFFSTDFLKAINIKFHENFSRGSHVFHSDGQTDTMMVIVALRSSANAQKKIFKLPALVSCSPGWELLH